MSKKEVVETVFGRRSKYEIVRDHSWMGSVVFSILKDGKSYRGPYDELRDAVQRAKDDADKD